MAAQDRWRQPTRRARGVLAAPADPRVRAGLSPDRRQRAAGLRTPSRHGAEPATTTVVYPYGALRCLDALIPQLHPDGFVLVRDYSAGSAEPRFVGAQRFGDATAMPLNFTLIERHLQNAAVESCARPTRASMHTRLLTRAPIPGTRHAFVERFSGGSTPPDAWTLGAMARERAEQGLHREALDIYRQAIADDPRDWQLIAAAAQFTAATLGDPAAGLELACTALRLNPWYSPFLWNVLGECSDGIGPARRGARLPPRSRTHRILAMQRPTSISPGRGSRSATGRAAWRRSRTVLRPMSTRCTVTPCSPCSRPPSSSSLAAEPRVEKRRCGDRLGPRHWRRAGGGPGYGMIADPYREGDIRWNH